MKNPQTKEIFKKILKFVLIGFAGLTLLFIGLGIFLSIDDTHHKHLIEAELNKISVPRGCNELRRQYQASGIDTNSEWFVDYDCSSTNADVYKSITSDMNSLGYHVTQDYTKGGPNVFLDVSFRSPHYTVEYSNDTAPQAVNISQKSQLDSQVVGQLTLDIMENLK